MKGLSQFDLHIFFFAKKLYMSIFCMCVSNSIRFPSPFSFPSYLGTIVVYQ